MFQQKTGFTLIEALIVVIILGVLASISLPLYQKTVEKSFGDEARVVLQTIYTAQKMYRLDSNTYNSSLDPAVSGSLVEQDYLEDPNAGSPKFSYSITAADATTFTAQATRSGNDLTIDETGQITGTYP